MKSWASSSAIVLAISVSGSISVIAHAQGEMQKQGAPTEGSKAAQQDDSKPLELPDFSEINVEKTKPSRWKTITSCRTPEGRLIAQSDPDFEVCVSAARQAAQSQRGTAPQGMPPSGSSDPGQSTQPGHPQFNGQAVPNAPAPGSTSQGVTFELKGNF